MTQSLTQNTKYLLAVVGAVADGTAAPAPFEGVEAASLYEEAETHRLSAMVYHGLFRLGLPAGFIEPFRKAHRISVMQSLMTDREFARVAAALEANGLDYCPLKGYWTRELYPDRTMRKMSDIDLLIHEEDTEAYHRALLELGYECTRYLANTEDVYVYKGMMIEVHRALDDHGLGRPEYYSDPWRLAENVSGHCFRLRKEDSYLFTLAHTMKHFMYSGIGLRSLADIYIHLKYADLNREYVEAEAEKMGIEKFLHSMEKAALAAFGHAEMDEASLEIIGFMAECGTKGSKDNLRAATYLRSRSKLGYFMSVVFPPFDEMRERYPVLIKWPVLLPAMYVYRIFLLVFVNRKYLRKGMDQVRHANIAEAERLRRIHRLAGIEK